MLTMTIDDFYENVTRRWEKGKVNHPNDPGGATNDGVATHFITDFASKPKNVEFLKSIGVEPKFEWGYLNKSSKVKTKIFSPALLMSLSPGQCKQILVQEFWHNSRLVNVDSKLAAFATFDFCVNSGINRGLKYLQRSANKMKPDLVQLDVDGILGPKSYARFARFAEHMGEDLELALEVCDQRLTFLKTLTTYGSFGNGWTNRINDAKNFLKGYPKWVK